MEIGCSRQNRAERGGDSVVMATPFSATNVRRYDRATKFRDRWQIQAQTSRDGPCARALSWVEHSACEPDNARPSLASWACNLLCRRAHVHLDFELFTVRSRPKRVESTN